MAPELYSDLRGFERLAEYAGSTELALRTVLGVVRNAAKHGARTQVERWAFFRRAVDQDRP